MAESQDEDLRTLVARLCTSETSPVTEEKAASNLAQVIYRQRRAAALTLQEAIEKASLDGDLEQLAQLLAEKTRLRQR